MNLSIDTTTRETIIKLGRRVKKFPSRDGFKQSLVIEINKLMQTARSSQNSIDKIIVNPGPGSFTGLRVGISVANTLAKAWDKPLELLAGGKVSLALPSYNRPAKYYH